ncbi:MAG: hypothetical protein KGL92_12360 [Gammaproteobacteria bacterium]|nr:hypothetical protein [Gammaproteobacteria bacterium]
MVAKNRQFPLFALFFAVAAPLCGCGRGGGEGNTTAINGSIHIAAGSPAGAVATVNGSIRADDNAILTTVRTVNGGITIGAHASAESLTTVNGPVVLQTGARVSGGITVVNGSVTLADGARVAGPVTNVSGAISLNSAAVSAGITTVNGDITIQGTSHVEGGIRVKKPSGVFFHVSDAIPRIVIGPGAIVDGALRFDHKVALYVSDKASIGPVSGATPVRFSGPSPGP